MSRPIPRSRSRAASLEADVWRPGHRALNAEPYQQPSTGSVVLGAAIKAVRVARGKTMLELAGLAQCSKPMVALIEGGHRAVTKERLEAFQKALRCSFQGAKAPEWGWGGRRVEVGTTVRAIDTRTKRQLYPATSASNPKPVTPAIAAVTKKKRRAS